MNFSELKEKDVINIRDGKRLGKPIDLVLNDSDCVCALVVPGPANLLSFLKPNREGICIPWERVRRIGDDVILVDVEENFAGDCE